MPRFFNLPPGPATDKMRPEEAVQHDPDSVLDSQYLARVWGRMRAAHACTFAASVAGVVGGYALYQGAWPIAWLMASAALTGFLTARSMTERAYQWQKHDRDMRRDTERDYQIAIWDNMRLKENNDMLVQNVLLRDLSAAGAEADGDDYEVSPSAEVIFIDPLRRRDN